MHGAGSPKLGRGGGRPPTRAIWAKDLPKNTLELYQAALDDDTLLQLKDEIALIDARMGEKIEGLGREPMIKQWEQIEQIIGKMFLSIRKQDIEEMFKSLVEASKVLEVSKETREGWNEIYLLIEQRRKLVESERKQMIELEQFIAAEKLTTLVKAILTVITDNVKDATTRKAIAWQIGSLVSNENPRGLERIGS